MSTTLSPQASAAGVTIAANESSTVTGSDGRTGAWTVTYPSAASSAEVSVVESQKAGYGLIEARCDPGDGTGGESSQPSIIDDSTVTYEMPAGTSATCTLVNKQESGSVSWEKIDGDSSESSLLSGSVWSLTGPGGSSVTVVDDGDGDSDPVAGRIEVGGLAWGSYTLRETRAPAGFVRDDREYSFTVSGSDLHPKLQLATTGHTEVGHAEAEDEPARIPNHKVSIPALPLTGGLGADRFIIAGATILVVALALVAIALTRRRNRRP